MKLTKIVCLFFALANAAAYAQSPFDVPRASLSVQPSQPHTAASSTAAVYPNEFRSIDGTGNNPIDPLLGSASVPLLRMRGPDFGDGLGTPAGANEPSPRLISNLVVAQDHDIFSVQNASDYLWQWGQLIDHDMDLTPTATPAEAMNIPRSSMPGRFTAPMKRAPMNCVRSMERVD